MQTPFAELLDLLSRASAPHDVFGPLDGDPHDALKRRYRELLATAHPDRNPAANSAATEAFQSLQEWYAAAQRLVSRGVYGARPRICATGRRGRYVGYEPALSGDLCELFPAELGDEQVLLKVARSARNNDLLLAEAHALQQLARSLDGQPLRAHVPTFIEHFQLRDEIGARRQVNVLRAEQGYVSLAEVLRAYPGGLPLGDAAWMFNRLLAALGAAHDLDIVHGAVLPAHVLIRPADHNGVLIDWCYSVPAGTALKAISPPHAAEYPPEVRQRQPATPSTDLYMAARCLVRLLGGTVEPPTDVPAPVRALLRACLLPSPHRRPSHAWELFDDFQEVLRRLYGPRRFRPFHMPA